MTLESLSSKRNPDATIEHPQRRVTGQPCTTYEVRGYTVAIRWSKYIKSVPRRLVTRTNKTYTPIIEAQPCMLLYAIITCR